jgi:FlaA1/EpsC-like NDP-sugar epimerase
MPTALPDATTAALLERQQRDLDPAASRQWVAGRAVLITGAGGTIGAELARQIAGFGPARLGLLDHGEYALWQTEQDLAARHPAVARRMIVADVRDASRLRAVCERFRPDIVFHAAALKHVPIVEENPIEGLLTNTIGTRHVADAARASGAQAMVLISTDKAVEPASVMGASKLLAEMYCQALDAAACQGSDQGSKRTDMRCITVRFGNVLGSTGSVLPLFTQQLARGGPLTVTHPDMQRYFMSAREAVGLVLRAGALGATGQAPPGAVFVLDMGAPVRILDLARRLIRMAGLTPGRDVAIHFTGPRPGEKFSEQKLAGAEPALPTLCPGLLMATPRIVEAAFAARAIDELEAVCRAGQERLALALVSRLIPGFDHKLAGSTDRMRA